MSALSPPFFGHGLSFVVPPQMVSRGLASQLILVECCFLQAFGCGLAATARRSSSNAGPSLAFIAVIHQVKLKGSLRLLDGRYR